MSQTGYVLLQTAAHMNFADHKCSAAQRNLAVQKTCLQTLRDKRCIGNDLSRHHLKLKQQTTSLTLMKNLSLAAHNLHNSAVAAHSQGNLVMTDCNFLQDDPKDEIEGKNYSNITKPCNKIAPYIPDWP